MRYSKHLPWAAPAEPEQLQEALLATMSVYHVTELPDKDRSLIEEMMLIGRRWELRRKTGSNFKDGWIRPMRLMCQMFKDPFWKRAWGELNQVEAVE